MKSYAFSPDPYRAAIKWFGWSPDKKDSRDWLYTPRPRILAKAKVYRSVDLRMSAIPIFNQGNLGSCTANAASTAHIFGQVKQGSYKTLPSRLFVYYNARLIGGTIRYDSGAQIRDGIKSIAKYGTCKESTWPYVIRKFATKPTIPCYNEGLEHQAVAYYRVTQTLDQMKACLTEGYPFIFGFNVYADFDSYRVSKTGVVNMPGRRERYLGGHAVVAEAFDDRTKRFTCRNSWGAHWGNNGFFTLPYEYLTNRSLASDFWTVRLVEL